MATRRSTSTTSSGASPLRKRRGSLTAAGLAPLALAMLGGGAPTPTTAPALTHGGPVIERAAPVCGVHCGTERWAVKTLSDTAARSVNMTAVEATVSDLVKTEAPLEDLGNERLNDNEKQLFHVKAKLVGFKAETGAKGDQDFHIVIRDLQTGETMIVEIPNPQCDGVCNSIVTDKITAVRAAFVKAFPSNPPTSTFVVVDGEPVVEVEGVGLYDFFHGQTGVAFNCMELHPVLSFKFPPPGKFTARHDPKAQPPPTDPSEHTCLPK